MMKEMKFTLSIDKVNLLSFQLKMKMVKETLPITPMKE
jgi:hypothetical protein